MEDEPPRPNVLGVIHSLFSKNGSQPGIEIREISASLCLSAAKSLAILFNGFVQNRETLFLVFAV